MNLWITAGIAIIAYLLGYLTAQLKKDSPKSPPKAFLPSKLVDSPSIKVLDKKRPAPEEEARNPNKKER